MKQFQCELQQSAIEALFDGDLTESRILFEDSFERNYKAKRIEMAATSFFYGLVIDFIQNKKAKELLKDIYFFFPKNINEEVDALKALVVATLEGKKIEKYLAHCSDVTNSIFEELKITKQRINSPESMKVALGMKLVDFLRKRKTASSQECISYLWGKESDIQSLKQKLSHLISRVNRDRKIILFDHDEIFRIN